MKHTRFSLKVPFLSIWVRFLSGLSALYKYHKMHTMNMSAYVHQHMHVSFEDDHLISVVLMEGKSQ